MVLKAIRSFFRRLYILLVDLYTFPELRPVFLAGVKNGMLGLFFKGPVYKDVSDSYGGSARVMYIQGVPLPPFPSMHANLLEQDGFKARSDDIWVVNWPKSGTHWMWEIVKILTSGRAELTDSYKGGAMFPELCPLHVIENMAPPRVLNTHVPLKLFPKVALNSKIIYVVRNPKDVYVSLYYHATGIEPKSANCSWNGMYELLVNGKAQYGDWFDHVEEWLKVLENNPNALIMTYEDMKLDLKKQVRLVAEFLGRERSEQFYSDVARLCSFQHMKKEKKDIRNVWAEDSEGIFRKGTVGDWRNHFTVAQNEEFNQIFCRRMKNINLDLKFEL
ncbi:bile salt sulfotransferase-like [Lingula anatina]|uniref:Bile salt sulfotransferase-like n=1 Tax=Lingula anatina TaxID=7574 RepID=A0A1S3HPU2_LINAN|nr:bile salt sulfotransferase-like [Lingula anatina]|eukprot:XP_013388057.1 bile salt sulfotransferase-like [Lingula anatina]